VASIDVATTYENSEFAKICAGRYVLRVPVSAFGRNIKRLREACDPPMNGKELGEAIGRDGPTISKWEAGKGGLPETPTLFRLAKNLKAPVEELLRDVDEEYDAMLRDLPWQGTHSRSDPLKSGRADVPASARARIQQLERENETFKARFREVQTITRRLFRIAVGRKARKAPSRTS
jgi:transcriptional regulator with XRE-family HTH domain